MLCWLLYIAGGHVRSFSSLSRSSVRWVLLRVPFSSFGFRYSYPRVFLSFPLQCFFLILHVFVFVLDDRVAFAVCVFELP
jgi:hypothetical protein